MAPKLIVAGKQREARLVPGLSPSGLRGLPDGFAREGRLISR